MKRFLFLLTLCFLIPGAQTFAAPQLQQGAIVNAASFAIAGSPNSAIAQGSLFTVFGLGVGPANAVNANQFPLPTSLGGVSIRVTAGGQDYECVILFALNTQVSAILPSNVPAGEATLVLTYNGEASNPITFTVTDHMPGVFSRSSTGAGQAVVQNYISPDNQPANALNAAAQPNQVVIIWTTGLGRSLNGDDRNPPAPGNLLPLDQLKVYVGGKESTIEYAGRSGCCSGVDQINIKVPEGVEGCFVPVVVTINGVPSNFTTMSINTGNTTCDGAYGLSPDEIDAISAKEKIRTGLISLTRSRSEAMGFSFVSDLGIATFQEYSQGAVSSAGSLFGNSGFFRDTCMVQSYRYDDEAGEDTGAPDPADVFLLRDLDAGASISVSGPKGQRQLDRAINTNGSYFGFLSNQLNPLDTYLDPGSYTIGNGAGGADVGAFTFVENLPAFYQWTNKAAINSIARNQGLTVTWTPTNNAMGGISISGTSISVSKKTVSALFCYVDPTLGTFTIPAYILSGMVESDAGGIPNFPAGNLTVGGVSDPKYFSAPGLDLGLFTASSAESKSVIFQ